MISYKYSTRELIRISLTVLFSLVVYANSSNQIDEECRTHYRQTVPDAVCHDDLELKACDKSCIKQARMKCGRGPKQFIKLKCPSGLFSCCCRVKCKRMLTRN